MTLAHRAIATVLGVATLAGCSVGHASSGPIEPIPSVTSTATSPSSVQQAQTAVSLHVLIPSAVTTNARRRRAYVSTATNSLSFSQNGGTPEIVSLAATSLACTTIAVGRTCTVNVSATPGTNQTFILKLFASTDGSGTSLSAQTLIENVVSGQTNPIAATLNGVVSSLSLAFSEPSLPFGQSGTTNLIVNALDASGQTIVGPGVFADANGNPLTVTLVDSDQSGSTSLARSSVDAASSVAFAYDGTGSDATITASAGSAKASASIAFLCGAPSSTSNLFVSAGGQNDANFLGQVSLSQSGTVVPADQIVAPVSSYVAIDGRGFVYTAGDNSINEYCPSPVTGVPFKTFAVPVLSGPPGFSSSIHAVAVDNSDRVAALSDYPEGAYVYTYARDGGGPIATLAVGVPITSGYYPRSLAADASGSIFVDTGTAIAQFPAGSNGPVSPISVTQNLSGGLISLRESKTDSSGNVYALYDDAQTNDSSVGGETLVEYAHGSFSNPVRVISGSNTQLSTANSNTAPGGLAVDPSGNVYVLETTVHYGSPDTTTSSVLEFGANQSGNVTPAMAFPVIGALDVDIAVDANGNLAIAEATGYGILLYNKSTYMGAIGVSANVGMMTGIAYDVEGNLYAQSQAFLDENGNAHGTNALLTFAAPVSASSQPAAVDPVPQASSYTRLAVDTLKRVYGRTPTGANEYAAGDTSGSPIRTIVDADLSDDLGDVSGIADVLSGDYEVHTEGIGVDPQFNTTIDNPFTYIDVLPPSASGRTAPLQEYFDQGPSTIAPVFTVDANDDIYVFDALTSSIGVYRPGSTSPTREIVGPATELNDNYSYTGPSIAVDDTGTIYVQGGFPNTGVLVFSPSANGNVAPQRSLSIPSALFISGLAIGPGSGSVDATQRGMVARSKPAEAPSVCSMSVDTRFAADDRIRTVPRPRIGTRIFGICAVRARHRPSAPSLRSNRS